MPDKFKNKYRISSARLQNWDYGSNGVYFITICTASRFHYFGHVANNEMVLNQLGIIAEKFWMAIPEHFPFVKLENFVVMPNHVHGILIIDKPKKRFVLSNMADGNTETVGDGFAGVDGDGLAGVVGDGLAGVVGDGLAGVVETPKLGVSTDENQTDENQTAKSQTTNASKKWASKTIGSIVNQYKRICTINARKINPDFGWQSRYHDHIIRNNISFSRIQEYISNNPKEWEKDTFNVDSK